MRAVEKPLLWTGNSQDAREPQRLFDLSIEAVVDVAAEAEPAALPRDLIYCRFPLVDNTGNPADRLSLCLRTIRFLLHSRTATVVCCGAGMSRSVALAAAGYALARDKDPREVLKFYQADNPHDVMPAFWNEVLSVASCL